MRHAGTQEIETPRLILRRLLSEDADRMYVNWANDPDVTRFLRWEPHKIAAETRQLLEAWATLYPNEDYYQWAIVEKATGQVFGSISIYNSLLGEPQQKAAWPGLDLSEGIWEPGYCIGKAWWNKGFTTEALRAVVEYWFKNTNSNWLACCHAAANPASGRVMQKAGFVYPMTPSTINLTVPLSPANAMRSRESITTLCINKRIYFERTLRYLSGNTPDESHPAGTGSGPVGL